MLMVFSIYVLISTYQTALASAAHGGDYMPKGYIVALHVLSTPLVAILFWVFFRRGWQAKAELDVIAGLGGLDAVRRAYPLGIGYLVAWAIERCTTRRQQEVAGGLVIGLVLALLTFPVWLGILNVILG